MPANPESLLDNRNPRFSVSMFQLFQGTIKGITISLFGFLVAENGGKKNNLKHFVKAN